MKVETMPGGIHGRKVWVDMPHMADAYAGGVMRAELKQAWNALTEKRLAAESKNALEWSEKMSAWAAGGV